MTSTIEKSIKEYLDYFAGKPNEVEVHKVSIPINDENDKDDEDDNDNKNTDKNAEKDKDSVKQ